MKLPLTTGVGNSFGPLDGTLAMRIWSSTGTGCVLKTIAYSHMTQIPTAYFGGGFQFSGKAPNGDSETIPVIATQNWV